MTRTATQIIEAASARTGWLECSLLDILLQYIQNQGSNEAFADYIEQRVAEEEGMSTDDGASAGGRDDDGPDGTNLEHNDWGDGRYGPIPLS